MSVKRQKSTKFKYKMEVNGDNQTKGGRFMSHGPHHDCLMCNMAKIVGMMEKHPKDCDCEAHPKKKNEQKKESKVSASLGA